MHARNGNSLDKLKLDDLLVRAFPVLREGIRLISKSCSSSICSSVRYLGTVYKRSHGGLQLLEPSRYD